MTSTFLGLPIDGEIVHNKPGVEQITADQFGELVKALLDDENVVEFGWRQYTPYFNDGETCVFSACELWVRTTADTDVEDHDDLTMWSHPSLSGSRWEGNTKVTYDVQMPQAAAAAMALEQAIERGSADNVLLDLFGDHARITVKRDGITVDYYEHD